MGAGLTLVDALRLLPYLDDLGISTLYLSPIWRARRESTHYYDVVDPNEIDPRIGSRADLIALSAAAGARGMTIICDIVPNHVAASWENAWWWDVLSHGRDSRFADVFDIDWDRDDKVTVPVLADELDRVLDDMRVEGDRLRYHEHLLPLSDDGTAPVRERLEQQHYRLEHWRTASRNYRRFFDIDDLVAVKAEDPRTFALTHALVLDLLHDRTIAGVRVDHIDGLGDPAAYLQRLDAAAPPETYVVVEKILARDEQLRPEWTCAGTTGYDFSAACDEVFAERAGVEALRRAAATRTRSAQRFISIARNAKREAVQTHFAAELDALTDRLADAAEMRRPVIRRALLQATVGLPVYRTYVGTHGAAQPDRDSIAAALATMRNADVRALLHALFTLEGPAGTRRTARLDAVTRWQHLCAPAAAKGVEDTALYRYPVLLSRAEVGADPGRDPGRPDELHGFLAARPPSTMNASSTHDSKRGEDVRARIDVLSELPDQWSAGVRRWMRMNAHARDRGRPDAVDELYLYQTLAGTWPVHRSQRPGYARRIRDHMRKAAREAKRRTSWIDQDERYENALDSFIRDILSDDAFGADFGALARTIALHGAVNSLSRLLIKIAAPGVPDIYQGAELWHLRLVDPDNRAPVDFGTRESALAEIAGAFGGSRDRLLRDIVRRWPDGRIKLFTTWRALEVRRKHADVFERGGYIPLRARGRHRRNVVAFARQLAGAGMVVACVPRLSTQLVRGEFPLGDGWDDTRLVVPDGSPRTLTDEFTGAEHTGKSLRIADLLESFPVAFLTGGET